MSQEDWQQLRDDIATGELDAELPKSELVREIGQLLAEPEDTIIPIGQPIFTNRSVILVATI